MLTVSKPVCVFVSLVSLVMNLLAYMLGIVENKSPHFCFPFQMKDKFTRFMTPSPKTGKEKTIPSLNIGESPGKKIRWKVNCHLPLHASLFICLYEWNLLWCLYASKKCVGMAFHSSNLTQNPSPLPLK